MSEANVGKVFSLTGAQGMPGPPGKDGADGKDGKDGAALTFDQLTEEQKAQLKGPKGDPGAALTFDQLTEEQKAQLKGPKGDTGAALTFDQLTAEQKAQLKGDKGEPGATGATGATGPKGDPGEPPTSMDASAITGILSLARGGTGQSTAAKALYALINGASTLSSTTIATGDYIPVSDVSASTGKRITLANLAAALGGGGGVTFGTYTGNQSFPSSGTYTDMQSINLGFQPKFVLVGQMSFGWQPPLARYVEDYTDVTDVRLAYATPSNSYSSYYGTKKSFIDTITVLEVTSSGFSVRNAFHKTSSGSSSNWGYNGQYALNESGKTYFYLAIK